MGKTEVNDYYFVNPHGHTTRGIKWCGLHRDGATVTLKEVVEAAEKEFRGVDFCELLLFPGEGSFVLGTSDRPEDKKLKTLSDLIKEVEKTEASGREPDFQRFSMTSSEQCVFAVFIG